MELKGKVIAILEPRSGKAASTGNPWMVQEYVIETIGEQYPRRMAFEVFGEDKIKQFNIQMDEVLNVSFDINAREWQGRWFNGIRAWRVDRVTEGEIPAAASSVDAVPNAIPAEPVDLEGDDSADGLPF